MRYKRRGFYVGPATQDTVDAINQRRELNLKASQFFNFSIQLYFWEKKLKPLLVTIYGLGSRARLITPTKKESPFGGAHVEGLQHRLGPNFFISINTSIKQFLVILSVPILIAEKKWVISSQVDHCKASCTLGGSRTVGCLMSTFLGTEKKFKHNNPDGITIQTASLLGSFHNLILYHLTPFLKLSR